MLYLSLIYLMSFTIWGKKLSKKNQILFSLIPFIVINFLRFGYGADYFSYQRLYDDIKLFSVSNIFSNSLGLEPLFVAFSLLSAKLGISYHIFAGLFASTISVVTIVWLSKSSKNFEWSVLLFYVMHYSVWNLSALRQGLSMVILFYIFFNYKREYKLSTKIIAVVASMMIHSSAIIVPIFYLISKLKWKKQYFLYLLLLVPIIRFIFRPEIMILFESLPVIGKFTRYLSGNQVSLFGFTSLVRIFFFTVMYIYYDRLVEKFPKYTTMFNFVTFSFLIYLFIPFSTVIATRVTVYGYFLSIVVFPMIVDLYTDEKLIGVKIRNVMLVGLMSFSLFSFYNEYDKMVDRTGYVGTLTELNTVTVFNGTYDEFDRQFALMMQINERNMADLQNSEILKKSQVTDATIQSSYNENESNYVATLKNANNKVIINERGEVIDILNIDDNVSLIGPLKKTTRRGEMSRNFVNYKYISNNVQPTMEVVDTVLSENAIEVNRRETSMIVRRLFDLDSISNSKIVRDYNMMPVENVYVLEDEYGSNFKYLEISTSFESYYALLSSDGEVLVDKWYNSITSEDISGLVIGYTEYSKEFINKDGEVFWIELLN